MAIRNYEFKAKVDSRESYEQLLLQKKPDYKGEDHQIDTYFKANKGRLKLREGSIENALIEYFRPDASSAKSSEIRLFKKNPDEHLKAILENQFGIMTIVDKKRKIYFIDNVKFHFDHVEHLGDFIEVEVIDETGDKPLKDLQAQCDYYFNFFKLKDHQVQSLSYSDMIMGLTL